MSAGCETIQLALVAGQADAAALRHLEACSECRFFRALSREHASAQGTGEAASALGRPFEDVIAHALATGEPLLGRFQVRRVLGRGGQGVVVAAWDERESEEVAVKLARSGSPEVANAHRVRHPGVCRVYFSERHGEIRLIVMELIDGPTLAEAARGLGAGERLRVFGAIADAVHAAHEEGVLHLDLKPENVLLRGGHPIVTDFGMSIRVGDPRAPGGTLAYMAPEQRRGDAVDRRADVYALGVMLRELVPGAERAAARATAGDPVDRFPTAAALREAVDPAGRSRRRWRAVAAVGAGLAALAVLALGTFLPPAGRRARWYPELWGEDILGREMWSVAADVDGEPVASIEPLEPATGCARNARELLDGVAQYQDPYHGYAFPGLRALCIPFELGPECAPPDPDAELCAIHAGRREPLGLKARDRDRAPPGVRLGQLQGSSTCDRDQSVVITLDRPRLVAAVRAWFHDQPPRSLAVELEDDGAWVTASRTFENAQSIPIVVPPSTAGGSAPVTLTFGPVTTRRVRFSVRCDAVDPVKGNVPGNPVWLTEVEVFSPLGSWEAWRRRLLW
jgi:hypothetical protein